jgi:TPR repeat protein
MLSLPNVGLDSNLSLINLFLRHEYRRAIHSSFFRKSGQWHCKAADQGHTTALYNLRNRLTNDQVVNAGLRCAKAHASLGLTYEFGMCVKRDYAEAALPVYFMLVEKI